MMEVSYIGINASLFLYIVTVARDTNNIDFRPPGAVGWIRTNGSFHYTPLAGERTRPAMRLRHNLFISFVFIYTIITKWQNPAS